MNLRRLMPEWKKKRAKEMRANPTRVEAILWSFLRRKQLGAKFRRQSAMRGWIADFYCPELKLIIEVDGPQHDACRDQIRDKVLGNLGLKTIRFHASKVYAEPAVVINEIREVVSRRRSYLGS